jgi:tRNA:m4X modification enzyme
MTIPFLSCTSMDTMQRRRPRCTSAGLLDDAERKAYVELGAGKGHLALALAMAAPVRALVLNDVRTFQLKADRYLGRLREAGVRPLAFVRCQADLKDFVTEGAVEQLWRGAATDQDIGGRRRRQPGSAAGGATSVATAAPQCAEHDVRAFVGVGKHLCGPATDFALRSLVGQNLRNVQPTEANCSPHNERNPPGEIACTAHAAPCKRHGPKLAGLCIATCCHFRCSWQTNVGRDVMTELGIQPWEFEMMCWVSGWSTCGHEAPNAECDPCQDSSADLAGAANSAPVQTGCSTAAEPSNPDKQPNMHLCECPRDDEQSAGTKVLGREERRRTGMLCKRLIDHGRLMWLRQQQLACRAVCYVHTAVSGENQLLLARTTS